MILHQAAAACPHVLSRDRQWGHGHVSTVSVAQLLCNLARSLFTKVGAGADQHRTSVGP